MCFKLLVQMRYVNDKARPLWSKFKSSLRISPKRFKLRSVVWSHYPQPKHFMFPVRAFLSCFPLESCLVIGSAFEEKVYCTDDQRNCIAYNPVTAVTRLQSISILGQQTDPGCFKRLSLRALFLTKAFDHIHFFFKNLFSFLNLRCWEKVAKLSKLCNYKNKIF